MLEIITLGAGCFWCVEAVFSSALGVSNIDVGYCNGESKNPTYEMVCSGNTGHAERSLRLLLILRSLPLGRFLIYS